MDLDTHRRLAEALPFGKRLPEAICLFHPGPDDLPSMLWQTIRRAEIATRPDPSWNLLKIHLDQCALTFLTYPEFDSDPHPALAEATKINLNSGSIIRTDYRGRTNPPILHRKETFLPPTDPRIPDYAALTKQEEEAGLYRDPSRIGLRVQWQTLLKRLNLIHEGHRLVSTRDQAAQSALQSSEKPEVARHRTAIKRYNLSKPVKQLLERGLLRKSDTFFDYGCGHGMDIEALRTLGYEASGWDPAFRPSASKVQADVHLRPVIPRRIDPGPDFSSLHEVREATRTCLCQEAGGAPFPRVSYGGSQLTVG